MRITVVGHVEWVTFAQVERLPASGEIIEAAAWWEEPGGGGAVAARELVRLGAEVDFLCALGDDDVAERTRADLEGHGITVHAAVRPRPQRRALTLVDAGAERSIVMLDERLLPQGADDLPWDALPGADGCYIIGADDAAIRYARGARVLVAAARARDPLRGAHVEFDAVVSSALDPGERLDAEALRPPPVAVVTTLGAEGGRWTAAGGDGTWAGAPLPGTAVDTYGCGDCFAAALTFGLAEGRDLAGATALGAERGAECLTRHGP